MPVQTLPLSQVLKQPNEESEGHRPHWRKTVHHPLRHTSQLPQGREEAVCGTVGTRGQEKIKTESGRYISSSYKAGPVSSEGGRAGPSSYPAQPLGRVRKVAISASPQLPIGGG